MREVRFYETTQDQAKLIIRSKLLAFTLIVSILVLGKSDLFAQGLIFGLSVLSGRLFWAILEIGPKWDTSSPNLARRLSSFRSNRRPNRE
jgi:hypothetical protein